jgi:hypothetical protein
MIILHLLPDAFIEWIVNTILIAGALTTVAGFFVRFVPFVNQYRIPVQIAGILLLTTGVYFRGGYSTEMAWRERVREAEARVAAAQATIFALLDNKQREFIEFVLSKYVETGVEELDQEKLPILLTNKYQSLEDAKDILGDVANISRLFIEFQQHLYKRKVA